MMDGNRRADWLLCCSASILFCVLTFHDLRLPGPNTDEVFTAAPAVNFYNNSYASQPPQIDPSVVPLFGRALPLMLMTYVGSVQTFLYVPVFFIFGHSIEVVRIVPILIAVAALWFGYFFFRNAFDRTAGAIMLLLTVTDPGFVFFTGRDFGPPALALLCKMAGLYFFLRWWRTSRPLYLPLASFIFGVGVYHKADFLWIIMATAVAATMFYFGELRKRLSLRAVLFAAGAFCIGAAPFLAMNILTLGATFALFRQNQPLADQLSAFVGGIGTRAVQTFEMMNGTSSYRLFMGEHPSLSTMQELILPVFVVAGMIALAVIASRNVRAQGSRKALFIVSSGVFVFLLTAKSPTALMDHHLMALYPLFQGISAAGWSSLLSQFRGTLKTAFVTCILVFVLAAGITGIVTVYQTYGALEQTGGRGYWSDAIYDLTTYLEKEQRPVAAMNWGFTANLITLGNGTLTVHRVYKEFFDRGYESTVVTPFIDAETFYLFQNPTVPAYASAFRAFQDAAALKGFVLELQTAFHERDGREVYRVFKLRPQ